MNSACAQTDEAMIASRNALAAKNVALAYRMARDFAKRHNHPDVGDLEGEALHALTIAAGRFDDSLGIRFSTYACSFIYGKLQTKTIRRPGYTFEMDQAFRRGEAFAGEILVAEGRRAADAETEKRAPGYTRARGVRFASMTISTDAMAEANGRPVEFSEGGDPVAESALVGAMSDALTNALGRLSPHQARVLTEHFGEERSMEAIAKRMGVSKQYVYEQRKKGVARLRSMLRRDPATGEAALASATVLNAVPGIRPLARSVRRAA